MFTQVDLNLYGYIVGTVVFLEGFFYRYISRELRPSVLDDLGLIPAIRSFLNRYSEHYNIDVLFECQLDGRLGAAMEITIYRLIQEALTNIRKYAATDEAAVTLREQESTIRVVIEDKGKGFDKDNVFHGVGLVSMEERAKSVEGKLQIRSLVDKGTVIVLEIPR